MQMEPNTTAELPLTSPATGLNGATPPKRTYNGRVGRPNHDELKRLVIAAAELKPKGFSTAHVAGWIRTGRKAWSPNFVNKFVKNLADDGLIRTTGACRKKRRLYVLTERNGGAAPVGPNPKANAQPTDETEAALKLLEELGEDVTLARKALQLRRAREIKARLEAELK